MRKILLLLLLVPFQFIFAQQAPEKWSFSFQDTPLKTAIATIENKTGHRFYFDPEWLENNTLLVTENFTDSSLETVLENILGKTELNFLILKDKVVLTKNRRIYDQLAEDYFSSDPTGRKSADYEKPIFQNDSLVTSNTAVKKEATAYVGKESKKSDKKTFTLSGHIKDSKTGEPLANVAVKIRNSKITTVTDALGYYQIQVPSGTNILETDSFSHKKIIKKVVIYNNGSVDLKADENFNQLDEVVVDAKKREVLKSAVTGVTVIDIENMKNIPLVLGEKDIFKVATILPGIKSVGEGASGFNVRGGKEDQNLILLDNALLYNPSHFFGFFSAVNPFTVSKASIYKGSIPAEFGGRLSSVFDITTKNGNTEKFSGEGGIGPVTSNLTLSVPIVKDKSSLMVGGRATYSDWILKSLEDESLKNSSASFYDAILKYSHKFNANNNLESTFYYSRDAFSITSDSLYKYSNRLISLQYNHIFNAKNRGSLILTNSEYKFNIDYDSNVNSFDFGYKLNETQLMFKMNYTRNEKHKFTYGLSSKLYGINPGDFSPTGDGSLLQPVHIEKEKGLESAAFIADSFKFSDKLLIDVGLRYSVYSSLGKSTQRIYQPGVPLSDATVIDARTYGNNEFIKTYGGLEPRIAARYFLMDDFSIKASYDKTYQYIHLLSNNTTQSPTDTWKLSDLNVAPQVAQQFSVGLYKNFQNDMYELSLEGYTKKSDNFLDYKVGAELLLNENIETELLQGEGKAYGIELLLKKSSGRLNGWIGYTYSRTFVKLNSKFSDEKVNNGKYFSANFDKPHDVSVVLNYKFTKRYSLSSNFIYQTGRPITYPIGTYMYNGIEYTLYSDRNKFRIPDYFRLDLGINIEGNHKIKKLAHSFWNISVYNVLGRNNPYSVYFVTENGQIKAYKTSIFSIPIPTITYNFKF